MGTIHQLRPRPRYGVEPVRPTPDRSPAPDPQFLEQLIDRAIASDRQLSADVDWPDPYWELQDLKARWVRWMHRICKTAAIMAVVGVAARGIAELIVRLA
jgi:hypothetical protein